MKLTTIFTRRGRMALAAALGLFIAAPTVSDAAIVALKEGGDIDYTLAGDYSSSPAGGQFGPYTQFEGLGNTATNVDVDETRMTNNDNAPDLNFGQNTTVQNGPNVARASLFKWDLSGLPGFAGSTVNAALVRIYQVGGNGDPVLNRAITHDFDEATVTIGSPAGNPFGAGPGEWGPGSDSLFSVSDDLAGNVIFGTASVFPANAFGFPRASNDVVGKGYNTWDATSDVQLFANGNPNYGWGIPSANDTYLSSENANNGARPVLFIDYTPVPEPATMVLLGLGAVCMPLVRRRK